MPFSPILPAYAVSESFLPSLPLFECPLAEQTLAHSLAQPLAGTDY